MDRFIVTETGSNMPIDASGEKMSDTGGILPRDIAQSHRLHEIGHINSHTDPITGNDVMGTSGHPFVVDGILTVYFESEQTRQEYLNKQIDRPVPSLGSKPSAEYDRGG